MASKSHRKKASRDEDAKEAAADKKGATKKRTLQRIMLDADTSCTNEIAEKFNKVIGDIMETLGIEDDRSNIVDTLMKIELKTNSLIEARDFLVKKDLSSFPGKKTVNLE